GCLARRGHGRDRAKSSRVDQIVISDARETGGGGSTLGLFGRLALCRQFGKPPCFSGRSKPGPFAVRLPRKPPVKIGAAPVVRWIERVLFPAKAIVARTLETNVEMIFMPPPRA